jgi:hypothetical protein
MKMESRGRSAGHIGGRGEPLRSRPFWQWKYEIRGTRVSVEDGAVTTAPGFLVSEIILIWMILKIIV